MPTIQHVTKAAPWLMKLSSALLVIAAISSTQTVAAPPTTKVSIPNHIEGATTVDSESLIKLAQTISLTVIDSRISEDRAMGHIEDSLSLADIDTSCKSLKTVISSLESPTAFYCNGPKCGRSVKATRMAVQCGYTKLYWFKGGFSEWKKKDYPFLVE